MRLKCQLEPIVRPVCVFGGPTLSGECGGSSNSDPRQQSPPKGRTWTSDYWVSPLRNGAERDRRRGPRRTIFTPLFGGLVKACPVPTWVKSGRILHQMRIVC